MLSILYYSVLLCSPSELVSTFYGMSHLWDQLRLVYWYNEQLYAQNVYPCQALNDERHMIVVVQRKIKQNITKITPQKNQITTKKKKDIIGSVSIKPKLMLDFTTLSNLSF